MRRTERLFQIIQILRAKRSAVTGRQLADELGISLRSLYRDMAELIAQRVPVRGEAGTGYVLDEGYDMPPLMLTPDELEAAVLGAAWVAKRGDPALVRGARDLIAKIAQSIPQALRPVLLDATLKPISMRPIPRETLDMASVRRAVRDRFKIAIAYRDGDGSVTSRTIWPVFIAYMEDVRIIVAWCELRQGFRHFRTDRMDAVEVAAERIPERQEALLKRWKALQKLTPM
ncbi:YafY family protein [Methylocapsa sp. S129]|uniref:helix-turn-helix transcriptional regulator n=1 Tax=Methylocapsa sp. S129 TaxID=1641869 RepID=UPI00131EBA6D|nr:YafY family protein [Methylocapsa sp. S129]